MKQVVHIARDGADRTECCDRAVRRLIDPVTTDPSKVTCKAWRKVARIAGSGATLAAAVTVDVTEDHTVDATEDGAAPARRLVILESPYAGDVDQNIAYARAAMRDSLDRGEAPLGTHLLYAASGVLDDADASQRAVGIEAGLAWGGAAVATVVYHDLGISSGMSDGIAHAKTHGRPVEYRTLAGWAQPDGAP